MRISCSLNLMKQEKMVKSYISIWMGQSPILTLSLTSLLESWAGSMERILWPIPSFSKL